MTLVRVWTIILAACMLAPARSEAQGRSTLDSVYSVRQAASGKSLYGLKCRSCHTPEGQSVTIKARWAGQALWDMFVYVSENMPKDNPGSLETSEDTQALAYLLQMAGMPAGATDLPADSAALSSIRFDTLTAKPGPTVESKP